MSKPFAWPISCPKPKLEGLHPWHQPHFSLWTSPFWNYKKSLYKIVLDHGLKSDQPSYTSFHSFGIKQIINLSRLLHDDLVIWFNPDYLRHHDRKKTHYSFTLSLLCVLPKMFTKNYSVFKCQCKGTDDIIILCFRPLLICLPSETFVTDMSTNHNTSSIARTVVADQHNVIMLRMRVISQTERIVTLT